MDDFGQKMLKKGYGYKTLNNTKITLIIKKLKDTIDKVSKLRSTIINFPYFYYIKSYIYKNNYLDTYSFIRDKNKFMLIAR